MQGIYLEHLTWPEAESAMRDRRVYLLPLGARLKEHGHHLPLNNDWTTAEYLCRRALERFPALALPTLQYGYYPAFLEYPGSVSVRAEIFRELVCDVCESLAAQAKALGQEPLFYVLNTGISTLRPLEEAKRQLAERGIRMEYLDTRVANADLEKELARQERGTHADELETSMMLYLAPDSVKMERARADANPDRPATDGSRTGLTRDPAKPGVYSPSGAWGDPTLATRDKGRRLVENLVDHVLRQLEQLAH